MRTLGEEVAAQGFDIKVTHRDPVTGLVKSSNPYTLRVVGVPGGGTARLFERPVGSGNLFNSKNVPWGRWVKGEHAPTAEHVEFIAPLTADQKLAKDLISKETENAALRAELESLKRESDKGTSFFGKKNKES